MALIAVALVVLGAAVYVVVHNDPVRDAGSTPALPSDLRTTDTPTPRPSSSSSTRRGPVTIAFLGDDWTAGLQASSAARRFPQLVGTALGTGIRNIGSVGGGYGAAEGDGSRPYSALVDEVVRARPQLVVVTGGRNDVLAHDVSAAGDKAASLFTTLSARLPQAKVVVVAPMWGDSAPPAELDQLARNVRDAAKRARVTYLDVADPIRGHPSWMANASDPDDRGYAALATALVPRLRPLVRT